MLCFEVYLNDERICTAGIGSFGVLTAIVSWVSHSPAKMARWACENLPATESERVELTVCGLGPEGVEPVENLKWVEDTLAAGDEIRIRLIEAASADVPKHRYLADPVEDERRKKEYVLRMAKEFGWEIRV